MSDHRPTCEYCGQVFDDVEAYARHQENEHGSVTSVAEQKLGEVREQPEGPGRPSQADRLAGIGEADSDHGEAEAYEPEDREVHRPATPVDRDRADA